MNTTPFWYAVMPRLALQQDRPVEYLMLADPRPAGPVLGFFRGSAIASAVVDYFGRRYVFAGIATRRRNGQYDTAGLGQGERLIEPGLIYKIRTG